MTPSQIFDSKTQTPHKSPVGGYGDGDGSGLRKNVKVASTPPPAEGPRRVGVDPGPAAGGLVVLVHRGDVPVGVEVPLGSRPRMAEIRRWLEGQVRPSVAIEWVIGGRIASAALIETAVEVGRVIETVLRAGGEVHALSRPRVGALLGCRGDAHTRRRLIDLWSGLPGATPSPDRLTTGSPGVPRALRGVARDGWSALAVAHASLLARDKIFRFGA